jgi:hypothetical protein
MRTSSKQPSNKYSENLPDSFSHSFRWKTPLFRVAKRYDERKGFSYPAWRSVGVSAPLPKKAGITRGSWQTVDADRTCSSRSNDWWSPDPRPDDDVMHHRTGALNRLTRKRERTTCRIGHLGSPDWLWVR